MRGSNSDGLHSIWLTAGARPVASTTTGYRLFQLSGAIPAIGTTVDIPELGERVVLRLGRSPLWQDQRTCVFLEQLAPEPALVA